MKTRESPAVPMLICQGPFYLKSLVKKWDNSKTIAFRVMSLALQCNLSWWASIPSLVLKPLILFEKWAILKLSHYNKNNDDDDKENDLAITTVRLLFRKTFLRNKQVKNDTKMVKWHTSSKCKTYFDTIPL